MSVMASTVKDRIAPERATYARVVAEIGRFLSAKEIGGAVGVGQRTVQNWRAATSRPRGDAREALLDLHFVISALGDVYTEEGVGVVLRGRAKSLGGRRPLEVFAVGERDAVVELAGQLRDFG